MIFDKASRHAFDSTLIELTKAAIAFGGVDALIAPDAIKRFLQNVRPPK